MELVKFIYYFFPFSLFGHPAAPLSLLLSVLSSFLLASLVLGSFPLIIFQAVLLLLSVSRVPCRGHKSPSIMSQAAEQA